MIGKMLRQRKQHVQRLRGQGFPGCPGSKESPTNAGGDRVQSLVGKIPWGRKWQPAPVFFAWRILTDRGASWATVPGAANIQT